MNVKLGDQLNFSNGTAPPAREPNGPYPVYGSNGAIGCTARHNASGPLIVLGRVGSYCGSVRYCDSDVWVTDNAIACRAKDPTETRYWYYALRACRLNDHRTGSGQPLLTQRILRDISIPVAASIDRPRVGEFLGALDDKIAANNRVIATAEGLMLAIVESVTQYAPLSNLASRTAGSVGPGEFGDGIAHFSFPAYDDGAWPASADVRTVRSCKFLLPGPCVLFSKLNPRIPRVWNVIALPVAQMPVASTEFVVLTPLGVDTSALWSALCGRGVSEALQPLAGGTSGSRQRIRPDDLLAVRVRDVRRLSANASRTITTLGELCHARRAESTRLAALRNALLPLLMSGEVRITG